MLQRSLAKKRSGEAGFTLVELLVVIAILGILAAIVVFAVGGIGDKGKKAADQTTCSVLQTAEEAYYAKQITGAYYTDMAGLVAAKLLHQASTLNTITLVGTSPAFTDYTVDDFRNFVHTNLDGFIFITQLAVKQMLSQGTGGSVTTNCERPVTSSTCSSIVMPGCKSLNSMVPAVSVRIEKVYGSHSTIV